MNHWKSGPASLVRRLLRGKERDAPLREYLTEECLVWRTPMEGKSLEEESKPHRDMEPVSHKALAQPL